MKPEARRAFSERAIHLTLGAGLAVMAQAVLIVSSLSGLLGVLLVFLACAMSEENYYRGVYRVRPPVE